ncbi:hypothetical protein [Magnetospirillum sp. 15-1]|uniref:hypothetical protein n=1 Tax=Magnetospirillum sp. 15-1 TaxID=1979370 RepID=UPI000BBCC6CB|nr:hypothetical protein [Magnetospirillum sp. 15-1]
MALLYLDIDGVLLRSATPGAVWNAGWEIAPHAGEFLRWAIERHTPYWLTTRDRSGMHVGIIRAFRECRNWDNALDSRLLPVTPLQWDASKAAAIDMEADFYWIDDNPDSFDLMLLEQHGRRDRWIEANTDVFPNALPAVMTIIDTLADI